MRLKNEHQLVESGIPIPQIHTILKNHIPNFDERLRQEPNYNRLVSFLKKALEGTELCVSNDNHKLTLRESRGTTQLLNGNTKTVSHPILNY